MSRARVLIRSPGLGLVRCGDVIVQVRCGPLTEEALDQIAAHLSAILPGIDGPCGYISILEEGAVMADAALRRRQRELVSEGLKGRQVRVAVVHEGGGITQTLFRAAARMVVPGHGAIRFAADVREAIEWVRGLVRDAHGSDLIEAVELGRQAARTQEHNVP